MLALFTGRTRHGAQIIFTLLVGISMIWPHPARAAEPVGILATMRAASAESPASLEFYSPDAQLLHTLPLPADVTISSAALAPDGRHWVGLTGVVSGPEVAARGEILQHDLTLHVYSTLDGAERFAMPLLPADFPTNLDINAELLLARDASLEDSDFFREGLWQVFKSSLGIFAWSPDGHQLAFSAATDGPSSDLYLYDMATGEVQRLTDGIEQIDGLRWSPNGQWIWHSTIAYGYCQACGGHHYAAAADGSRVVELPGDDVYRFIAWADGDSYLVTNQANGPGDFALQRVDIPAGTGKMLWAGTHQAFVYDGVRQRLGILGTRGQSYDPNQQLYLLNLITGREREFTDVARALALIPWLAPLHARPVTHPCQRANPIVYPCVDTLYDALSPDGRYRVTPDYAVVEVRGGQELLPLVPDLPTSQVLWRPDGAGFFIPQRNEVLYRDLATGDLTQLRDVKILRWLPHATAATWTSAP